MLDDGSSLTDTTGDNLLFRQPVANPGKLPADIKDWPLMFRHLESRLTAMRGWRYPWWVHWSSLTQYFNPKRFEWLVTANRASKGNPVNDTIIDSTGLMAVRTCANGMWSGLTSPSRPWFSIHIALPWVKPDALAQEWLEDTQERLYSVLAGSNFYTILAQAFEDVVVIGTAPIILFEDNEKVFQLYLPVAGEYYLSNGARQTPDTLYTEIALTVAQIVEKFGIANCPEEVRAAWKAGQAELERQIVICMAIEPNFAIARSDGNSDASLVSGAFDFAPFTHQICR